MNYLQPSEYENYTLESTTPASLVNAASALIDGHCRRPTLSVQQYSERVRVRPGRNTVRLTYLPLQAVAPSSTAIVSARGRLGVPRRGEENDGTGLTAASVVFGLPGTWTAIDVASLEYCAETGEVSIASHLFGLSFTEIEITYTAGLDTIPDGVKFACAQIVKNAQTTPGLNVKSGSLDRMQVSYFSDSLVDATVRAMLAPYVAQKLG